MKQKEKKNIIISIPLVWCYRNFYLTGIIKELDQLYNVYLAVPEIGLSSFIKNEFEKEQIIILKSPVKGRFSNWIFKLAKICHSKVHPINTEGIFKAFNQKISWKSKVKKLILFEFPSLFLANRIGLSFLKNVENRLFYNKNSMLYEGLIRQLNPAFVLSTANVADSEWPLFRIAQKLNIPTLAHILSFDNITSRGYLPIDRFNQYWVWNKQMKEELVELYGITEDKIKLTGTPQFDFHIDEKYKWNRVETLSNLGFKSDDDYLLYCANHYAISPNEPELLAYILPCLFQEFPNIKLVLRLHPMDQYDRWDTLLATYPDICLSIPWVHESKESIFWGEPTVTDLVLFSNTLRYARVMLNIASTVSIDAALTDTPTICVGFHPSNQKEGNFYQEVHYSKHYKPIMDLGATPLASSVDALMELIALQMEDRDRFVTERKATVTYFLPNEKMLSHKVLLDKLKMYV